jgi:hypothetical protein
MEQPTSAANVLTLAPAEVSYQEFGRGERTWVTVEFLDYLVDGRSLRTMLLAAGYGEDVITPLCPGWGRPTEPVIAELLGGQSGHCADVEMLVCKVCGDGNCGTLIADVTASDTRVVWRNWRFRFDEDPPAVEDLPALSFERHAYEAVLRAAPAAMIGLSRNEPATPSRRVRWPWRCGRRLLE